VESKVVELRCGSVNYFGIGAIEHLPEIMERYKKMGISRVAIITGRSSYRKSGVWEKIKPLLEALNIEYAHYDGIKANPTVEQLDDAVKMVKEIQPQAVVGIGGGSPLDSSKAVAVLLRHPDRTARDLYRKRFTPLEALPVVAVNLTHGTGSEVDRYAVATIPEDKDKSGIGFDCIYPQYAIDDPTFTLTLSLRKVLYTSLDTLNHAIEAATTTLASAYTVMLAREVVELVARWLPVAVDDLSNLEARYWLLYASVLGGIAIDCAVVHLTHPMEHTLSAVRPELAHGLGLSILLPSVIKTIYPAKGDVLSQILKPIVPKLKGTPKEAKDAAKAVEEWIFSLGVKEKLHDVGFSEEDIPELVKYLKKAQEGGGSLSLSPVPVDDELLRQIYYESLSPIK
jgi:alcohol dehydrogenase class IV